LSLNLKPEWEEINKRNASGLAQWRHSSLREGGIDFTQAPLLTLLDSVLWHYSNFQAGDDPRRMCAGTSPLRNHERGSVGNILDCPAVASLYAIIMPNPVERLWLYNSLISHIEAGLSM